jgi:hypothetical protein
MGRGFVTAFAALAFASSAFAAKTPLPAFHSPTGNITCLLPTSVPATLRCAIGEAAFAKTLQNFCVKGAGLDWHGFELGATRKAGPTCSGGILYDPATQTPRYVNLPYGTTWRHGVFACVSAVTGITCRDRTGHGIFISRQSWRAW